ncbi:hypothetical protein RS130_17025 [Paraglaciecola aquimarina]|uniref:Gluconokinase n=1 Tax=Paraglaciecola aquimarina TaxID=1235557 RepID=A0ABU3SZE5_9ALTE|nr:hypothetical protein [Paraglaciecola aquimarina]MDU0355381.1 hypothetical protein [Paraglaciecola aquimarina]
MPETLLDSQLATLEEPKQAIIVSLDNTVDDMLSQITKAIK